MTHIITIKWQVKIIRRIITRHSDSTIMSFLPKGRIYPNLLFLRYFHLNFGLFRHFIPLVNISNVSIIRVPLTCIPIFQPLRRTLWLLAHKLRYKTTSRIELNFLRFKLKPSKSRLSQHAPILTGKYILPGKHSNFPGFFFSALSNIPILEKSGDTTRYHALYWS